MSQEQPDATWRRWLGRLMTASRKERVAISAVALVLAVVIGMVFVFLSGGVASCNSQPAVLAVTMGGSQVFFLDIPLRLPLQFLGVTFCYNPVKIFEVMVTGSLFNAFGLAGTLKATTLLILAGLSVAISFRAGLFNIGTQGQFVLGALSAGIVAPIVADIVSPGVVGGVAVILASILAASAIGGLWGAIPGILKAYADANEVITTIMLNIIASGIAVTIVRDVMGQSNIQTPTIPSWALFNPILAPSGSRFSILVLIGAIALVVVFWYILNYSAFGYNLRVSGVQEEAAEYSGVNAKRVIVATMTLAGIFGGLAGAAFVLMAQPYWSDALPGFGFDGITVSVLAANSPAGIIPAAFLFGVLRSGTVALQLAVDVPPAIVDVLRGIIVLLVAMPEAIRYLAVRSDVEAPPAGGSNESTGVTADD
ncbi:MAG: ABC transporter permease [Halobacteriaceae archaeon]